MEDKSPSELQAYRNSNRSLDQILLFMAGEDVDDW